MAQSVVRRPAATRLYVIVLFLLMVAIGLQLYFAAVGAFDRPHDDASFVLHRDNGRIVIPALTVLATIVAAVARMPKKVIALTLLPAVLDLLQMVIRAIADAFNNANGDTSAASVAIFGFHAINGMLIMLVVLSLFVRARALLKGTAAQKTSDTVSEPVSSSSN